MEQETILYYYPMPQQASETNNRYAAKRHWFQEAALKTEMVAEQEEFCVLGCAVPPFYYRKKAWKPQILSETMETALGNAAGMADTYVHPQIRALLTEERCAKWMPREGTVQMLVKYLLGQHAGKALERCGAVTALLGDSSDTGRQMEVTWELLQPYLPRVNRMLVYYEGQEEDGRGAGALRHGTESRYEEEAGQRIQEELREYLETYYYEYGLLPQLEPYRRARSGLPEAELRCGKEKCRGVILDFCSRFRYPKILAEGSVYIDIASSKEKEQRFRQKGLAVPYVSPLKYLDTMVKNSYDRKVKMT